MNKIVMTMMLMVMGAIGLRGQQFVPLWPQGGMPNSRGMLTENVAEGRLMKQVGTPGIYVYVPDSLSAPHPAVLICPSGGFAVLSYVTSQRVARWFNEHGMAAFVLLYRLPISPDVVEPFKAPLQDAQRAMKMIWANAAQWGIDAQRIGVMGISAGGNVAASLCTAAADWAHAGDAYDGCPFRPSFAILQSAAISMTEHAHADSRDNLFFHCYQEPMADVLSAQRHVDSLTPPTFIVHAANDPVVPVENSLQYFQALMEHKRPSCSLHIFPQGQHDMGVFKNPGSAAMWPAMLVEWLHETGILKQ